jgi:hypothetical protein
MLAACASAPDQASLYNDIRPKITVRNLGGSVRDASSAHAVEPKWQKTYAGAGRGVVIWVQVDKKGDYPAEVTLMGSRASSVLESEVSKDDATGPWDRPEPALVGFPWHEADFEYTDRKTQCFGVAYWCSREVEFNIHLPHDLVVRLLADEKSDSIPIALYSTRHIDWRMPRAELLATVDALNVRDEFR